MEIHLIRHTEVENPDRLCYGFADITLKESYQEDFELLNLHDSYDLIVSSPLQRCRLLAEYTGQTYEVDDRLKEMNFGDWEMVKWTEIPAVEINPWYEDFVNLRATNGENLLEMQNRVLIFWKELIGKENLNKVLLVTHGGVIRVILQSILKFPLENMFSIQIDYGKKVIIKIENKIPVIRQVNV
ncbi:alpha-ribazole phosphatase [Chryseobacterium sp.]|uniref:alpha-ribazole phosphatase n=1 Tax=Chryseobacterium sp. TaxID=1871047 RepID=UPI0025C425A3|nr:alpha-ribazole phosphatase [Chryseobacterium sp.]